MVNTMVPTPAQAPVAPNANDHEELEGIWGGRQWIHRGHLPALRVHRRAFIRELDLLLAERATRQRGGTRTPDHVT